ncbi:MAG: imidazole glycerol phosphate synthase subunit HisF [Gemmatimonadetes bacterium]|nr:imidazole glycerol phosphate synthase subunit HisF [Gemmatimonadota bacterium]
MLTRRVIVCLDVGDGRVVKGTQFVALRDVGDPAELAAHYEREGADELVFLDISASSDGRATLLDTVRRTAERLFIPLTVGGGVRSADDVARVLRAGADKVAINSAAVARPEVLTESAEQFGAQCVVASIDARREGNRWVVWTHGARTRTDLDAVAWAEECVARGAGEILLTSIEQDGARTGYDLALTRAVADAVPVPVIASGGAGVPAHLVTALIEGGADAALVAGIVHDGLFSVAQCKSALREAGLATRAAA